VASIQLTNGCNKYAITNAIIRGDNTEKTMPSPNHTVFNIFPRLEIRQYNIYRMVAVNMMYADILI
jgi:hypothetical protein